MRNIELKAVLRDYQGALDACRTIGAVCHGEIAQTDTYFHVPDGRLKLRVAAPGGAELIYYQRPDTAGARGCDYRIEPVQPSIEALLRNALGVRAIVEKVRTLYLWENVRIHLDQVTGLGQFIEFEAVQADDRADPDGFEKLTFLSKVFSISEQDQLKYSYLDMILGIETTVCPETANGTAS